MAQIPFKSNFRMTLHDIPPNSNDNALCLESYVSSDLIQLNLFQVVSDTLADDLSIIALTSDGEVHKIHKKFVIYAQLILK